MDTDSEGRREDLEFMVGQMSAAGEVERESRPGEPDTLLWHERYGPTWVLVLHDDGGVDVLATGGVGPNEWVQEVGAFDQFTTAVEGLFVHRTRRRVREWWGGVVQTRRAESQ